MDALLDTLSRGEGPLAYLVLLLSAALEYVFPPFPGDTVTLFGAFLITARGWNGAGVMAAVTTGSLLGATIDYYIGRRLGGAPAEEPETWLGRYWWRASKRMAPLIERLRARGASYIVVNRFLPGVRALFFVAAGMAGLSLRSVLFWGAVSALLWNALIIVGGAALGSSWERLHAAFETYTTVAWVLMTCLVLGAILRWAIHRRRSSQL